MILSDGSRVEGKSVRERSPEEVGNLAVEYVSEEKVYSLGGFAELDAETMAALELFITYLMDHRVEVILYLPPYHPYVYEYFMKTGKYRNVGEAEHYFRNLAEKIGVKVLGGYNPRDSGCGQEDLFDGMHPKGVCVDNVIREVLLHLKH